MNEFADLIRALPDDALAALLKLRPDLLTPVPSDTLTLAARAQSAVSVARALDGLDRFTLEVLDGLRLGLLTHPFGKDVSGAVDRLRARFLVYGGLEQLRIVAAVEEVSSPYPAGLGRPAAELGPRLAELAKDPARLRRAVMSASPQARAVLDRLAEGPPVGTFSATGPTLSEPVSWLVEHHLLAEVSPGAVELPRELGVMLRRDAGPLGEMHPNPPAVESKRLDQSIVDNAGAGQAMDTVRHIEALLEALAGDPAPVLRGGGMGVLPLRRLAKVSGVPEADGALFIEIAYGAGLIGELETSTDTAFIPAAGYDQWREAPVAQRWARIANAWLALPRQPSLAGGRDERDRPLTVLSPQLERLGMPMVRRAVLEALADGATPSADELIELIRWRAPRRMRGREGPHREAIREAGVLGLTGAGGLTSFGRALLRALDDPIDQDPLGVRPGGELPPEQTPAVVALTALLPPPVDHVLVQADLTVVVPGPAEPSLTAELELTAEHESGGGASVYRVTPASIRRALDAGYPADEVHALFKRRSRTSVPQALTFLIDDVARTHGGLRTGSAGAYLRGEDESLVTTVLADRALAELQLRRLAPTVLVTPFTAGRLLASLREAGYSPVPEDATGATVLSKPRVRRAPGRSALGPQRDYPITTARLMGVVEEMRRGDARLRVARRAPAEVRAASGHPMSSLTAVQAHTQALAILQQAVRDKVKVWVGYVDAHGAAASRLVRPVSIGAGYLRAEDERTQMLHTFALHRITAAALPDSEED